MLIFLSLPPMDTYLSLIVSQWYLLMYMILTLGTKVPTAKHLTQNYR